MQFQKNEKIRITGRTQLKINLMIWLYSRILGCIRSWFTFQFTHPTLTYYGRSIIPWNSKLEHFSTIHLLLIIVISPLNLFITEKEEEFQDSDVS